jgi:hypothetical protein
MASAPTPALYAALSAAQATIGHASKDATNPHFKSRYASLPAVLDAIRQPFADHGLCLIQAPSLSDSTLSVETIIAHKEGGTISCVLSCSLADAKPQTVGSAISYLRRYGAMALAGVAAADEDDDGEKAQGGRSNNGQSPAPHRSPVAAIATPLPAPKPGWTPEQRAEAGGLKTRILAAAPARLAELDALANALLPASETIDRLNEIAREVGA